MRLILPLFILWTMVAVNPVWAGEEWFADVLEKTIRENHCDPVTQNQKKHPVYLIHTDRILVLWCIVPKKEDYSKFQLLVIPRSTSHEWAKCPNYVPVSRAEPNLLWIDAPVRIYGKKTPLNRFWSLDGGNYWLSEKQNAGPADVFAEGPGLFFGFYDAGQVLYCHEGKWLMGGFH